VAEAVRQGHAVRALLRDASKASQLPSGIDVVIGDVTEPHTLSATTQGVDAVVFTLGSDGLGSNAAQSIDYGGVRNVLSALGGRKAHIALMTAIGVTDHRGAHDWKRRAERLVRASGLPYTIVRPGWFDYNAADQHRLQFLQGDTRHAGDPSDGVVSRQQIAQVLVTSLVSQSAQRKTFELVAEQGPAQSDLEPLFAALEADAIGSIDGIRDAANLPLNHEPPDVRADLRDLP
jgi:uncharacterized protein YbjT (DUF2867 family)